MKKTLQDQLLKAGLANKQKAKQIHRAKKKQKQAQPQKSPKGALLNSAPKKDARALQAEKDRQRNIQLHQEKEKKALLSQVKQIINSNKQAKSTKGTPYYFESEQKIKRIYVDERQRIQLATGQLGVVEFDAAWELLPAKALNKVQQRGGDEWIQCFHHETSMKQYLSNHEMEDYMWPQDYDWD